MDGCILRSQRNCDAGTSGKDRDQPEHTAHPHEHIRLWHLLLTEVDVQHAAQTGLEATQGSTHQPSMCHNSFQQAEPEPHLPAWHLGHLFSLLWAQHLPRGLPVRQRLTLPHLFAQRLDLLVQCCCTGVGKPISCRGCLGCCSLLGCWCWYCCCLAGSAQERSRSTSTLC